MSVIFVSRHAGARAWLSEQGLGIDRLVTHLDVAEVQRGDTVIGTLPLHIAAALCARGGRFLNLTIDLPPEARGKELSAAELHAYGARLEEFHVRHLAKSAAER